MRLATGLGAAIVLIAAGAAEAGDLTSAQVVEALKRHVCFSRVWWGDPYARLGQAVTVDVRLAGPVAYAWSEDIRAVPRTPKWADSYVVVDRAGGPMVTQRSGYNIDLLRGEAAYERDRRRVYGAASQRLQVELPAGCAPRFDPEGPLKAEMRAMVRASLTNAVRTWGRRPAGGQLKVTFADFNVDYPETFALRQDTGEVLRIALLSADPGSYLGGAARQYVVTPAPRGPTAIALRRLVQRHGRTETIRLR